MKTSTITYLSKIFQNFRLQYMAPLWGKGDRKSGGRIILGVGMFPESKYN